MTSVKNSATTNLNEDSSTTTNLNVEGIKILTEIQNENCSQQQMIQQEASTSTNLRKEESTSKTAQLTQNKSDVRKKSVGKILKNSITKNQPKLTDFLSQAETSQISESAKKRKNTTPDPPNTASKKLNSDRPKFQFSKNKLFAEDSASGMEDEDNFTPQQLHMQQGMMTSGGATTQRKGRKPPPIFISSGSALEIRRCTNEINKQPGSFLIDIKKDKQGTKKVTAESWTDHEKLILLLKSKQHRFHTHYSSEEPQTRIVIYGLPEMETEELQRTLKAKNITPARIVQMRMKHKKHKDDQNYLLYFSGLEGNLLQNFQRIKCIGGFKVQWAKYINQRTGPSQCSNCLQFGHGQRGCNKPAICFRCSEEHNSKTCPHLSKESNKVPLEKLKCHFCEKNHTAISQNCNVRLQIIEKWKAKSARGNNKNKRTVHQSTGQQEERVHPTTKPLQQSNRFVPNAPKPQQKRVTVPTKSKISRPPQQKPATTVQQKTTVQGKQNNTAKKTKTQKSNNDSKQTRKAAEAVTQEKQAIRSTATSGVSASAHPENQNTSSSGVMPEKGETSTSRCMLLLTELFKIIAENPECLKDVQQAIGSFAQNSTLQYGL